MSIEQLQKKLITGPFVLPVCILATILLRIHSGVDLLNPTHLILLLLQITIPVLLLRVNHIFTIVRSRTILPAFLYLLLAGTDIRLFSDLKGCILSICFLLALLCSFSSYQRKDAQPNLFNLSLLIAIGSLLWAPFIMMLPLFWGVSAYFQALNAKSMTASFLALLVFSLFIFTYGVYRGDLAVLQNSWQALGDFFPLRFRSWETTEMIRIGYSGTLILISFLYFKQRSYAEKIKNRSFLYVLFFFILILFICLLFSNSGTNEILSILHLASAFVLAHYFTLSQSKLTSYIMLISILFYVIMYFCMHYQYLFDEIKWIDSISIF